MYFLMRFVDGLCIVITVRYCKQDNMNVEFNRYQEQLRIVLECGEVEIGESFEDE